jgi:S-DNA-T family DNA segregation ATPase FtsK/SpoIIIE
VVIDEFPALFMGVEKSMVKEVTNNISNLLQRGRHAKIHMVLASQNPTLQNMKVDLGNITARIAFKCAKKNFSETILGEGGAENLAGHGDLLLRSPQFDSPQRVQGVYITPKELQQAVQHIKIRHCDATSGKFNLVLPSNDLAELSSALGDNLACSVVRRWPPKADQQLASVILWALEHDSISTNMLMKEYGFGWNTASKLVSRLEELRIVGRPDGKLPQDVIPGCPEDIPEEIIKFLEATGYSKGSVINAIYSR